MTSYEEFEPEPLRGWSPFAVASIATLVLLLGLGGALFGIYVADQNTNASAGGVLPATALTRTEPVPASPTLSPTPSPSPSPSTSPSPSVTPSAAAFPLPSLAGQDFRVARTNLRDLKLGWDLVFEGTTGDLTVRTTDPVAGTPVTKGTTVHVYIKGPAPLVTTPNLVGQTCAAAATMLTDAGLVGAYPAGRDGVVKSQVPAASDPPTLHWNQTATVVCG